MTKTSTPKPQARRGRPKGVRNIATIVREAAHKRITFTQGGIPHETTVAEALLLQLRSLAMTGDVRADKAFTSLRERLEPQDGGLIGCLVVPDAPSQNEWVRRVEIEDRFRQEPEDPRSPISPPSSAALAVAGPPAVRPPAQPTPRQPGLVHGGSQLIR